LTDEADRAVEELKSFLTTASTMVPPGSKRDLAALHLHVHPGGQCGSGGRMT
jgi:hypothetical protein